MKVGSQLAQARPGDTNNASLYTPPTYTKTRITALYICNTSGAGANARVFHDDDGSTYSEANALFWDIAIAADTTTTIETEILMDDTSGHIGIRSDTADALTFTLYGEEIEDSQQ